MRTIKRSQLIGLNISYPGGRRGSLKIEPQLKASLQRIAKEANTTVSAICRLIETLEPEVQMASAVRVYIVNYWEMKAENNAKI